MDMMTKILMVTAIRQDANRVLKEIDGKNNKKIASYALEVFPKLKDEAQLDLAETLIQLMRSEKDAGRIETAVLMGGLKFLERLADLT